MSHLTPVDPSRRRFLAAAVVEATAIGASRLFPGRLAIPALVTRCRFGAWAAAGAGLILDHRNLETSLRVKLPVFSWFKDWGSGWDAGIAAQISALHQGGSRTSGDSYDCMIAWEAWGVPFAQIVDGSRDAFLAGFFDGAKTYPGRVIIRLFHEMNGNWYPWSAANSGRLVADPQQWQQAWRRIVGIARRRGADNVRFMFCANNIDVGPVPVQAYWPGRRWVDAIGIDGYNWGWNADGTPYSSFEQVFDPMYRRLTRLHPTAEVMVGEVGCAAHPHKSRWYVGLYESHQFPRLTQIAFFDEKKEQDWRISSDPGTLSVARTRLRHAPLAVPRPFPPPRIET